MSAQSVSVSVIVPVYNNATTVVRALDSIRDQTVKPQEIIVVDDASTDDSYAVVEKYIADVPTAKLLRLNANRGPSAARNMGWEASSGEYLAFLDADDSWHSMKIKIQFSFLQNNPEFVISGHAYQILNGNSSIAPQLTDEYETSVYKLKDFLIRNRFSTPTVMLRRSIDERFDEAQRYSEDYQLWLRIIANYKKAAFIHLPMTYLYKSEFGESGSSGKMFDMYRGELANTKVLARQRSISRSVYVIWRIWLTKKFFVRLITKLGRKVS